VAALDGEVTERDAQRQRAQPHLDGGAERALVVAVDDRRGRVRGSPDVVVGAERRYRCGAEVGQARASKIRFAPGSSLGLGAS
jgi:hypothetical protein